MEVYLSFLKEWGSLILSFLAICGGIFAYFRHDRQIKSQAKILNELQIKQLERERSKELMADIKANFIRNKIRFYNAGKSDAHNIRVEMLTSEDELRGFYHEGAWGPYDLINAQSFREEPVALCIDCPDFVKVKVIWDDGFDKNRSVVLSIPLS